MFTTSACTPKIALTAFLLLSLNAFSGLDPKQQMQMDSLNGVIDQFASCRDTSCIEATLAKGKIYFMAENLDSAESIYFQVIEQLSAIRSNELTKEHLRLKAHCYAAFGLLHNRHSAFTKAYTYFEKSLVLCEELMEIKGIVSNLSDLVGLAQFFSNDSLLDHLMAKVYRVHPKIENPLHVAYNWETIGRYHEEYRGDMDSSILAHKKALTIFEGLNRDKLIAISSNRLGVLYARKDDVKSSTTYLYRALRIEEALNNQYGVIQNNLVLANLYTRQHKYEKAQEFLSSALALSIAHGFHNKRGNIMLQMGINCHHLNELKKAEEYFESCIYLMDSLQLGASPKALIYTQLGAIAQKKGDLARALDFSLKGLQFNTGITQSIINQNLQVGKLYYQLDSSALAKQYIFKALELSRQHSLQTELQVIYMQLYDIYSHEKDHKQALFFFKESVAIKDSLDNLNGNEILIEKEAKYRIAKKEQELALERKTSALLSQEQRTQNFMMLGLSMLLLAGLLAFFIFYQRKRLVALQANHKIILQLHEIDGLKSSLQQALSEGSTATSKQVNINDYLGALLSQRELEVLQELTEGKSNKDISESLCISVNTVTTHLKKIYAKLEVGNRTQAVKKVSGLRL